MKDRMLKSILIDEMQEIIAVRSHRVTQINNGYLIPVILFRDGTVVSHDVALAYLW